MSQIDMVGDVLLRAEKPHGREIEHESIVSTLIKKVKRGDRFVRTGKNGVFRRICG